MDNIWAQFGVAGIVGFFGLQVVKEILSLLKSKRGAETAGDQSVDFWRRTNKELLSEALSASVVPILSRQTDILDELKASAARQTEAALKIQFVLEDIRATQERHHENLHGNFHQLRGRIDAALVSLAAAQKKVNGV